MPASTLDAVGDGSGAVTAKPTDHQPARAPLTANGKPEVLYMGAEYCPYCAAERWAMIVALSRFGTFSGLHTIHSAVSERRGEPSPTPTRRPGRSPRHVHQQVPDVHPGRAADQHPGSSTGTYTNLQTPTTAQQALLTKYDAAP